MMGEYYGLTRDTILLGKDFSSVAKAIYLSDVSPHMYFLLSLFVIRAGSCVWQPMLRRSVGLWIAVTALYIVAYQVSHPKDWFLPGADPILLAAWGLQFYALGILLQKADPFIRSHAGILLAGMIAATATFRLIASPAFGILLQMSYVVTLYLAMQIIVNRTGWSFAMGKQTMGIYLLHAPLVVWIAAEIANRLVPSGPVLKFVVATCLTILVSWQCSKLISRSRVGQLMFGKYEPGAFWKDKSNAVPYISV
jgi:peptidoglycan/LPS O-acetylase OafA/YrhL